MKYEDVKPDQLVLIVRGWAKGSYGKVIEKHLSRPTMAGTMSAPFVILRLLKEDGNESDAELGKVPADIDLATVPIIS